MNLCKYKNILGELGKGVHSFRVFGVAIVDVILHRPKRKMRQKYIKK